MRRRSATQGGAQGVEAEHYLGVARVAPTLALTLTHAPRRVTVLLRVRVRVRVRVRERERVRVRVR